MSVDAAWAGPAHGTPVPTSLRNTDFELTVKLSRQSLDHDPENADVLRLLVLAQLGLGDVRGALETSKRLENAERTPATLDAILSAHLAAGDVRKARDLVADAMRDENMPPWAVEAARARIALNQNDGPAARAILIRGIEREPNAPWLRGLLVEVFVAEGRAAEARDVIDRLGSRPVTPAPFPVAGESAAQTGT